MTEWLRLPTRQHAAGVWVTCDTCRESVCNSRAYTVIKLDAVNSRSGNGRIARRCFRCAVQGVKRG